MHSQSSFLLQNQLNPFPISGDLLLADDGTLSFTLDAKAAGASLGWLEKELGRSDLKESIQAGEQVEVFSFRVGDVHIAWPKTLGGYAMKVEGPGRSWIVSLNYPSGGAVWQTINMIKAKGTTKPWKDALAAAGVR